MLRGADVSHTPGTPPGTDRLPDTITILYCLSMNSKDHLTECT